VYLNISSDALYHSDSLYFTVFQFVGRCLKVTDKLILIWSAIIWDWIF